MNKKQRCIHFFLVLILMGYVALPLHGFAAEGNVTTSVKDIELYIDSNQVTINNKDMVVEVAPFIQQGRTFVPLRFLGEALGAKVKWSESEKQATLVLNDTEVLLGMGSEIVYVNGVSTRIDVEPVIREGRMYIPVRFVGESFGATMEYDAVERRIRLYWVDQSRWIRTPLSDDFSLLHPSDWLLSDNGVITLTTPNAGIVRIYSRNNNPDAAYNEYAKYYLDSGWVLEEESFYNKSDYRDGFELHYIIEDDTGGKSHAYVLSSVYEGYILIKEGIFEDKTAFEEASIMGWL